MMFGADSVARRLATLQGCGITLCVALAMGIALWRLYNPPIEYRMQRALAEAEAYIRACEFQNAYDAFRRAAALDGTDPRPRIGMTRAFRGQRNTHEHRRFGKGCSVSKPD